MFIILVLTYVKLINAVDHNLTLELQLTIHQKYLNLATFLIYYSNYNFLYSHFALSFVNKTNKFL